MENLPRQPSLPITSSYIQAPWNALVEAPQKENKILFPLANLT